MRKLRLLLACLLVAGIGLVNAQTKTASGTVISSEDGQPVIGASVIVKGTTVGVITDANGKYSFSVPSSANTIAVSLIGMKTVEVPALQNQRVILVTDATELGEVVVIGAMGIARPPRATGFGQTVVNPENATQKAEPDLFRSLDGKIPGVNVISTSSTAGSATKVMIRGVSSFGGNPGPLYVVDGIPYSNTELTTGGTEARLTNAGAYGTGISTLDPNDIETMDVLKGAAASALYGSRATNGVILITTKSGSKRKRPSQKKFEITVTSSYTSEKVASLPTYQNKYGQGSEFNYSAANGSWGPAFGGALDSVATPSNYLTAYPDMNKKMAYKAYPNNVKDLFRTGGIFDNSINMASYNDKGNFNTTVSRLIQDGFIPNSEFERNSFSVGGNQKLDNGVVVGGTISYSRSIQDGPFFGAGNYGGSISSFARTLLMPRNIDILGMPYETPSGASLFPFSATTVDNPIWSWKNNTINSVMDRTVSTINASYDFTKWLSASYLFGWNQYELDRKQVVNIGSVGPKDNSGVGQITNNNYKSQELESNFNITAKHKFGSDFDLRVTLGHNVNQQKTHSAKAVGTKMIFKGIYNVDNTQEQTASEYQSTQRLWAIYADALLGYKNYAFLNFSIRNDHSSTLPVENRSYYYPALTGSLIFNEVLKINPDILNFGKVRAAVGRVGNDASPYYVNGTYLQDTPFNGNPIMLLPTTTYDPNLKPEFTTEFELGTELQFFQSRIGLDFTWYSRSSTNQIGAVSMPSSTGSRSYVTNFGEISNKGVEIGLTLVPVNLKNSFKWDINATFTKNINKIVSLVDGLEQMTLTTGSTSEPQPTIRPGYSFGYLRGSVIARDEEGNPLVNPTTGAYMESSELGDLGSPYPDFKTGIGNTFSYKGVSLSVLFDAKVGGVIVSGPASDMLGRGVTRDTEDRLGGRILPGVLADPDTHKPILDGNGNKIQNTIQLTENNLWFASESTSPTFAMNSVDEFQTFDATVFRLSEISLGYDLPRNWFKKTIIGSINLSVIARNLWHYAPGFPKYSNYDPGSGSWGAGSVQGIDRETAPSTRRIGFNVKLTF